jgi:hypothetical protein
MFYKLVDQSANISKNNNLIITTKEELFTELRDYLDRLFKYSHADDDSKLFWATYTMFVVEKDCVRLSTNMIGTYHTIFDVQAKKADKTSINIKPYKIDYMKEYHIDEIRDDLYLYKDNKKYISPLEVLGLEKSDNKWEGDVWLRSDFTGWNAIQIQTNIL